MPCRWWHLTPWWWWRLSPWRWIIEVGGALWCGTLGLEGHGILMMRLLLLGVVGFHLHTVEEFFMAHGGAIKVDEVLRVLHAWRGVIDVALEVVHAWGVVVGVVLHITQACGAIVGVVLHRFHA